MRGCNVSVEKEDGEFDEEVGQHVVEAKCPRHEQTSRNGPGIRFEVLKR